jgi:hypothetical protein
MAPAEHTLRLRDQLSVFRLQQWSCGWMARNRRWANRQIAVLFAGANAAAVAAKAATPVYKRWR